MQLNATYLPISDRKQFYNGMIKSVMLYGSTVWIFCSKNDIERVLKLQKRAVRVIMYASKEDRTVELFRKLNWIQFYDEVEIIKCSIIYNGINGNSLAYISDMFPRNADVHSRVTRHGHINILCPRYMRENDCGRSFTVLAVKSWNRLSPELRNKTSLFSLKNTLKKTFLDR